MIVIYKMENDHYVAFFIPQSFSSSHSIAISLAKLIMYVVFQIPQQTSIWYERSMCDDHDLIFAEGVFSE